MNRYFSAEDREKHLKLAGANSLFEEIVDWHSKDKKPDKEYLRMARTCSTLSGKMLQIRMKAADSIEQMKLLKDSHKHRLVLRPADQTIRERKEIERLNDITAFERDDFLNLASWTIETTCKVCTNKGHEVEECELRVLWLKYGVDPLGPDATDNCPYQYPEEYKEPAGPIGDVGEALLKAGARA